MTFFSDLLPDLGRFYGLPLKSAEAGPRGQTGAISAIITDSTGRRYFCKQTTDPVMMLRMPRGLAIADALATYGLSFVVAPLRGKNSALYMTRDNSLLSLFPHIDGTPTRDYAPEMLGATLGAVHGATSFLKLDIPPQGHASVYDDFFMRGIPAFLQSRPPEDTPRGGLWRMIMQNEDRLLRYREIFYQLGAAAVTAPVITHGDLQGNVLLGRNGGLHIIDWDEAELAPPERDLWYLSNLSGFMRGYGTMRRGFTPDPRELLHGALKAWIEGLAMLATAIIDGRGDGAELLAQIADRRFAPERLQRIDAAIAKFYA